MAPIHSEADQIRYVLEHAGTDPDKAEDVLELFCNAVEQGEAGGHFADVVDKNILVYLAKCFRQILSGEDPREALNLVRGKGQRKRGTREEIDDRNLSLARAVVRCMNAGTFRDDAIEQIASERNCSASVVRDAYDVFGRAARNNPHDPTK